MTAVLWVCDRPHPQNSWALIAFLGRCSWPTRSEEKSAELLALVPCENQRDLCVLASPSQEPKGEHKPCSHYLLSSKHGREKCSGMLWWRPYLYPLPWRVYTKTTFAPNVFNWELDQIKGLVVYNWSEHYHRSPTTAVNSHAWNGRICSDYDNKGLGDTVKHSIGPCNFCKT